MQTTTGIHCKVVCNEQIRRFQFFGTEFSSLQEQVKKLLGLNGEFVLKYKDNEDDMITISSTEELSCAIDISHKNDGGLIRLTVYSVEPTTSPLLPPPQCPIPSTLPDHGRGDFCPRGRGRGGRWGGGGGRRCQREGSPASYQNIENPFFKNRFEQRRAKLTFKRDMWRAYLTSLEEAAGDLSPEEERRKEMFKAKVQRLDNILAEFGPPKENVGTGCPDDISPKETVPPNCCPAKENEIDFENEKEFPPPKEKYRHKYYKKEKRQCRRKEQKKEKKQKDGKNFLTKEEKSEIKTLKNQIKDIKPTLWAIQEQLKLKKSEISVAKETNQLAKIPDLKNEVLKLKQEKRAKKDQIEPLRQRVHQLKGKKN